MATRKRSKEVQSEVSLEMGIVELDEAVRLLKTSRSTLYRWMREGRIRAQKVGRQWRFDRAEVERFLRGETPQIELRTDITPLLRSLEAAVAEAGGQPSTERGESDALYAVRLLLDLGVALNATDIHVAANLSDDGRADRAVARYRIDGVLHPMVEFDARLLSGLVAQWKMVFACNPGETSKPQDGLMKLEHGSDAISGRAHFAPSILGPTVVTRLLAPVESLRTLDTLGLSERDREKMVRAAEAPWGVVVADGPTGSGRTSTVYACLKHLADPSRKTVTIEDPVEALLPWVTQMQVRPNDGFGITEALVSTFRSDPDVLFVCEPRTAEHLHIAMTGAMNGHLVFTTMSAGGAAAALVRMIEMGAAPFAIGEAVKLVVSHRLARKLCPECSQPEEVPAEKLQRVESLARNGGLDLRSLPKEWRRVVGCPRCKGIGYRGRMLLVEALRMTPELSQELRRGATAAELTTIAVGQGMTTMLADGIRRAALGETSLDEVLRILAPRPDVG